GDLFVRRRNRPGQRARSGGVLRERTGRFQCRQQTQEQRAALHPQSVAPRGIAWHTRPMMAVSLSAATQAAVAVARIAEMEEYGVQIWTAQPAEPDEAQWAELALLLDETEQRRSRQFKMATDHRAYVLAHALRRAALARALAVAPHEIVISDEASAQPVLIGAPAKRQMFFSHSRSRDAVVFALSHAGPIGIDVASVDPAIADFDLLAQF